MTTIAMSWTSAINARRKHLAGLGKLPPPVARAPALRAVTVLSLLAETEIRHTPTPDCTKPHLSIPAFPARTMWSRSLLNELTQAVASRARGGARQDNFSAPAWLKAHDLDRLVLHSIAAGGNDAGVSALLAHAAQAVRGLTDKTQHLMNEHTRKLLARDAPMLLSTWETLAASDLSWILAHEHDGDPARACRVARRAQALELYTSLADRLRERAITAVIDAEQELVPALAARLALTQPQIRVLRQAAPLTEQHASYLNTNHEHAARQLQAHAIPLHQWPGGGRPAQQQAWESSFWLKSRELTLIRADYYGQDETVCDAIRGFRDDLLEPLRAGIATRRAAAALRSSTTTLCDHVGDMLKPKNFAPDNSLRSRTSLPASIAPWSVRADPRRLGKRRASGTAAPPRPPRCATRTKPTVPAGRRCARPGHRPAAASRSCRSPSAQALVEEGNAHHHCVGGYYDQCRSGNSQILSLRVHGVPAVTAEILLDSGLSALRVGQFKGLHDQCPDAPALHQAMREFLRDIRTGAHALNLRELRAYCKWAAEHVTPWGNGTLTLEHARAVFPLYLRCCRAARPPTSIAGATRSGLKAGLVAALRDLTEEPQALAA